eukprot:284384-Prymnesium_polylepis.1
MRRVRLDRPRGLRRRARRHGRRPARHLGVRPLRHMRGLRRVRPVAADRPLALQRCARPAGGLAPRRRPPAALLRLHKLPARWRTQRLQLQLLERRRARLAVRHVLALVRAARWPRAVGSRACHAAAAAAECRRAAAAAQGDGARRLWPLRRDASLLGAQGARRTLT